jgi:hypothetical protein
LPGEQLHSAFFDGVLPEEAKTTPHDPSGLGVNHGMPYPGHGFGSEDTRQQVQTALDLEGALVLAHQQVRGRV